ncbi:hypothetical protein Afil01_39790 [Actinorhabdospora filicis]|uniref:Uncharacterized protein n=1 Tax=Actinorhabdospora filicis TaxID=1785913 RepID=A0A9W6SNV4_9ACTN|nr:hypothetical protein [Actinorhabdospora filicis]GLZ79172.1 hypothetical protein Afil01_39790 [Actinorhabdospora filicis]
MRWLIYVAVAGPSLVLAGIGLSHPQELTADTARWWTNMHIILIPVFPLLAVAQWLLLRGTPAGLPGVLAWGARIAGWIYLGFYGALDTLAGIGTGWLVQNGVHSGGGHHGMAMDRDPVLNRLFEIGNDLGYVGAYAFVAASLLTSAVLVMRAGPKAIAGGVVLVAGSVAFSQWHIYWPRGVASQLAIAIGFALLAWSLDGVRRAVPAAG